MVQSGVVFTSDCGDVEAPVSRARERIGPHAIRALTAKGGADARFALGDVNRMPGCMPSAPTA